MDVNALIKGIYLNAYSGNDLKKKIKISTHNLPTENWKI